MAMTTTKQLLPAINSLYKIELTEDKINSVCTNMDTLFDDYVTKKFIPNEDGVMSSAMKLKKRMMSDLLEHTFYVTRNNNIVVMSGVTDRKECIELKKLNAEDPKMMAIFDEFIPEGETRYGIIMGESRSVQTGRHVAWFNTITEDDLSRISKIRHIIVTLYNNNVDFKMTRPDTSIIKDGEEFTASKWKSWDNSEDMVTAFKKDILTDTERLNRSFRASDLSIADITRMLKELFENAIVTKQALSKDIASALHKDNDHRYIMSVVEAENHRFAFMVKSNSSYYSSDKELTAKLIITPHTNESYNYIDAGRQTYDKHHKNGRYTDECRPFGDVFFISDDPAIPKREVLEDYLRTNANEVHYLDDQQLGLISKRYLQKQKRISAEHEAKQRLEKKIASKITGIAKKDTELKINDVVYTKDEINYQGQVLKITGQDGWVQRLLNYQTRAYSLDSITFDQMFDAFVSQTQVEYGYNGTPSVTFDQGVVGNVEFHITTQTTTNVNNVTSYRFYVNGYRVNKDEVHKCIERAICFETQSDFDYFLKSVSSCSLKIHRYLQLGVDVRVRDYFDNTEVVLKFPIERNKNINYIVLNDNEYRIRNTEKILRLERVDTIMDVINTLLGGEFIEGINSEDVRDVIDAGKQAYVDAIAKSKELLEHCEKVLDVKQELIRLKDGTEFTGYKIEGEYRTYAVNATDDRYSCYDIDTAQYICIVDKTNSAQVGLDMLVNRLFALRNDSRVATQIHTLKRRSNEE